MIATGIAPRAAATFDLMRQCALGRQRQHVQLLQTVHAINDRYGGNTVSICGMAGGGIRQGQRFRYPLLECG